MQRTNAAGLEIIKTFEGCKLTEYKDFTGIQTIGFGHTGVDVTDGMVITQEKADELLAQDVARFEQTVYNFCQVPLTNNQFSALVSFAYNVRGWKSSTLFRYIRDKKYAEAAGEFHKWCHAGGAVLPGLVKRRAAEQALFCS